LLSVNQDKEYDYKKKEICRPEYDDHQLNIIQNSRVITII